MADRGRGDLPEKRVRKEASQSSIGMTESILERSGTSARNDLRGDMKVLYSDFVVREIPQAFAGGVDGTPLRLTSLQCPEGLRTENGGAADLDSDRVVAAFTAHIGAEKATALATFACGEPDAEVPRFVVGKIDDKEARRGVHQAVRNTLGKAFISATADNSGDLYVERATKENTTRRDRQQGNPMKDKFLHFTLYKENIDSNAALRSVATKLRISTRALQFSGTKDKRAVTMQRVAVRGLAGERLVGLNNTTFGRNATVKFGDFAAHDDGLEIGKLNGNHFTIVIRLTSEDSGSVGSEQLAAMEKTIQNYGFINYFGKQRFGTTSTLTSDVGRALLQGNYREVVRLVLKSKTEFASELQPAFDMVFGPDVPQGATPDYAAALAAVPHHCYSEKDILRHLAKSPNDFLGAVKTLPRNLTMLYCHSVQSLAWNLMASRRIAAKWDGVMVGDLVMVDRTAAVGGVDPDAEAAVEDDNGGASIATAHLPSVKVLTQDDVDSGSYSLADVLLPVPGPDPALMWPTADCVSKPAYYTLLESLGASTLVQADHPLVKQFHFHGTYRSLTVVPGNVEFKLHANIVARQPIIKTDLELLQESGKAGGGKKKKGMRNNNKEQKEETTEQPPPASAEPANEAAPSPVADSNEVVKADVEEEAVPEELIDAIELNFSLPAGSYATSLVRELCPVIL